MLLSKVAITIKEATATMTRKFDRETLALIAELLADLSDFAVHPNPAKIPAILRKVAKLAEKFKGSDNK